VDMLHRYKKTGRHLGRGGFVENLEKTLERNFSRRNRS